MLQTRKRRRSAESDQEAETNEMATVQPSNAANFTAAVPSAASAQSEFLHFLSKIKMEASDSEAEFVQDESMLVDIKPDKHEIQKQWSCSSQHSPPAESKSTPASLSATATKPVAVTATTEQDNVSGDYMRNIDILGGDILAGSFSADIQVKNEIIDEEPVIDQEPVNKFKSLTLSRTDFHFDADEIDMLDTDSDEDGDSDVDLNEDYVTLENDDIADLYDPEWFNKITMPRRLFPCERIHGIIKYHPTLNLYTSYFFHILGGQTFFERLAECCSIRAEKIRKSSQKWSNTHTEAITWQEISIFIGISLQMGSVQLPTLSDYWECQSYHGFNGFSAKMTLHRFKFILEALNFECFQAESETFNTGDNGDKIYSFKPLLNFFNNRMETVYSCEPIIILNEPLIYWKGKLNRANEMSQKFRKNAIMLHLLTEQSGLVLKILAHVENPEQKQILRNPKNRVIQRLSIAIELLKEKFGKGHTVFACKYYGSYALCLELAKLGTYCSGFLDQNCYGNCKELVLRNLEEYKFVTRYAGYIMMVKSRRNRKNVYFYSSDCLAIYRNEMNMQRQLKVVKEIKWQLTPPLDIRAAMLDHQLPLEHTEIKWDRRLMIYIMHLVLLNAYSLYRNRQEQNRYTTKPPKPPIPYHQFRQEVIASLLNPDERKKFENNSAANENVIEIIDDTEEGGPNLKVLRQPMFEKEPHRPFEIPSTKGKLVKKRCRVCFKTGLLIFSKFCCSKCPGMPGLCQERCFELWHEMI